jgi:hypothetical protein
LTIVTFAGMQPMVAEEPRTLRTVKKLASLCEMLS